MAVKPGFLTGASAKIKIAGKTMAYAQSVNYNVQLDTQPIEVMSFYEVVAYEPIRYRVSGSLAVVRYTRNTNKYTQIANTVDSGNSPWAVNNPNGGTVGDQFDPSKIIAGSTCDLEVFQKQYSEADGDVLQSVVKISDCKMTSIGGGIGVTGFLVDNMSFFGRLVEFDGYNTSSSSPDPDLS